jgi:hypothetical protein
MSEFPVPLDNLIAYVRAMHPDGDPLANVTDAFAVSTQMDEQADALIGYFVDQARKSGASWSQIGSAMGVSKQAAQKRFVPAKAADLMSSVAKPFSRFTDRAARTLAAAGRLATAQGAPAIGVAHLAAALPSEGGGVAAQAIAAAGITPEQLYTALGTGPAQSGPNVDTEALLELSFDENSRQALKDTLRWALRYGHNYIGTEHLLLGILFMGGPVTDAFTGLGLSPQRGEQLVNAEFAAFEARRSQRKDV